MAIGKRDLGLFAAALAALSLLLLGLLPSDGDAQTPPPTDAELSIQKAGPETVRPNQQFDYTITVSNAAGAADATGVVVTDDLPDGVTFVDSDIEGAGPPVTPCTTPVPPPDGVVTCGPFELAAGATATITITVRAPAQPRALSNRARITAGNDPDVPINSNEVTTRVEPAISINKIDENDPVRGPNDLLLYILRVRNDESVPVGVVVTDDLPTDVDFVRVESTDLACTENGSFVRCSGNVAADGTATARILVEPEVAGTITNTASLFAQGLGGPVDEDTEETEVQEVDGGGNGDPGDETTCADFESQEEAQAALDEDPDLADTLDPDGNDIACEGFDFTNGPGDDQYDDQYDQYGNNFQYIQYDDITIVINREGTLGKVLPETGGPKSAGWPFLMLAGAMLAGSFIVARRVWG